MLWKGASLHDAAQSCAIACINNRLSVGPTPRWSHDQEVLLRIQHVCLPCVAIRRRQCFGELNVLLRTNSRRLRDVPLAGYTSLTRCAKAAAFNKLLSAEHLHPDELQHRYPPHVCAISVMLRRFFHSHDEASLCRYTVQTQDWMRPVSHHCVHCKSGDGTGTCTSQQGRATVPLFGMSSVTSLHNTVLIRGACGCSGATNGALTKAPSPSGPSTRELSHSW